MCSTVSPLLSNDRNSHNRVPTVFLFTAVTFLALNQHNLVFILVFITVPESSTVKALLPNYRNYHKHVLTVLLFIAVIFCH